MGSGRGGEAAEPGTLWIFGSGFVGLVGTRFVRKKYLRIYNGSLEGGSEGYPPIPITPARRATTPFRPLTQGATRTAPAAAPLALPSPM